MRQLFMPKDTCHTSSNVTSAKKVTQQPVTPVYILPCAKQQNASDCGVYAAAFAIEIALDTSRRPDLNLDLRLTDLRPHLIQILETNTLMAFPRVRKVGRGRKPQAKKTFI